MVNVDDMIIEIIIDLKKDRGHALTLLDDVETALTGSKNDHAILGPIAVQYLGKAQKSADQMIKLFEILKKYKEKEDGFGNFSDLISEQSNEEKNKISKDFDFNSDDLKSLLEESSKEEEEKESDDDEEDEDDG